MANGKATGREALAYLLTKGANIITAASSVKGTWYYVVAKAAAASTIPTGVAVGRAYLCSKAAALADGDILTPLTLTKFGFSRDKSLDASKTIQDATTDIDEETDNISDGLVAKTGAINGYDTSDSATSSLKGRFFHTLVAADGGASADTITENAITTPKDLVMIDWTGRTVVEDEPIVVDILPVIFTQMSKGASYGSVATLNFNFTVVASDDAGCKPTHYEGPYRGAAA